MLSCAVDAVPLQCLQPFKAFRAVDKGCHELRIVLLSYCRIDMAQLGALIQTAY